MNRKQPPSIKDAVDYKLELKPYQLSTLDNGIEVYTIDAGAQDVLQLEFIFYSGNSFESQKGIAAATNFMLKNGTGTRNAFQINEAFEYYGGYCSRSCFNETAVISLHTLNKHVNQLLPVIADMITDSVFPESEMQIYKQNVKQRLAVNLKKAEFVAGRLIDSYIYGIHHPYGTYNESSDIDAIHTDACKSFYRDYYLNGRCMIFVSGKIPADLLQELNKHFGSLGMNQQMIVPPSHEQIPIGEKKHRVQNDVNAVQGAIRIAMPFPNRHHPDFKKVMVLNTLYGGFFGSRLMSNIREDKGYTYGIYSYIQNHLQNTAWLISTEAGKDVAEATVEEVYKEMKALREAPVPADELLLVRNYMIGGILGELDGPFQIAAKWKNIVLNNLDENYFYDTIETIKNVTAEELMVLAQKYLRPEHFHELIVY